MKLIEALKGIKELQRKAEDIRKKVQLYCVDMSHENPTYGTVDDQKNQISGWLQAHGDLVKEILRLRIAVQKTNLATPVAIEVGGKQVTKSIAEWVHRRKDLATLDRQAWDMLNDKQLPPSARIQKTSGEQLDTGIRRYYNPKERDEKRELYTSEPAIIDGRLEVVNAVTDLIE